RSARTEWPTPSKPIPAHRVSAFAGPSAANIPPENRDPTVRRNELRRPRTGQPPSAESRSESHLFGRARVKDKEQRLHLGRSGGRRRAFHPAFVRNAD